MPCDVAGVDRSSQRCAGLSHNQLEFTIKNAEHRIDARLSESRKPRALKSADSNTRCAQGKPLEHVPTTAYAAINVIPISMRLTHQHLLSLLLDR